MAAFASSLCFSPIRMMMGFWVLLFLFGINWVPLADSSTLGVEYVSRLLEIQDRERAPPSVQVSAAYAALNRLIPSHSSSFQFSIISKAYKFSSFCLLVIDVYESKPHHVVYWLKCERGMQDLCGGEPCFKLNNHPAVSHDGSPEILISGTTGVELLSGLQWYLKYWCGSTYILEQNWWSTTFFSPKIGISASHSRCWDNNEEAYPWSYYQNAVSSSYTFAWWDWERWEKELTGWLSRGSICFGIYRSRSHLAESLPGAFMFKYFKVEITFVYHLDQNFNISAQIWMISLEVQHFLHGHEWEIYTDGVAHYQSVRSTTDPAEENSCQDSFQPSLVMFQLPLKVYIHQQNSTPWKLRMVDIHITYTQRTHRHNEHGKACYFMSKFLRMFTVRSDPRWCCTYLLDATDPLFIEIGAFIMQQLKEYGRSSHIYNCDTFDENTPPSDDPEYISSLAAAIFRAWKVVMSGLADAGVLFTDDPFWKPPQMKALLHSVPVGKLVVLDLYAEVKPVWATSEQFYGVPYIWYFLSLSWILQAFCPSLVGVGISMEGIEQNPVVYDLMSEMAFRQDRVNIKSRTVARNFSVEDLDTLLACHDGFLLGPWLESAKQLAQNDEQKKQFEWNARTQITMWFDNTEEEASLLRDYGNKYWSGLLRDYYGPRAAIYFKFLIQSLERGDGFRLRQWRKEWIKLTNDWQSRSNIFPTKSAGDALNVSQRLYKKYLEEPDSHDF
ncbi:Alpha-N-acetylglucosaminidase [Sesamum angolense]|uniref:Alpha-N-acetylglucosaminidase n=1 Tax=Sesamum angolense TaxID=2727404 RepID=A0AAE1WZJ4_9LAMI|nr:Alpha-N-acetylglucosaminidase [Sesamum angolense]